MKFVREHGLTEDPIQYNRYHNIIIPYNKKKESFARQGHYY